MRWILMAKQMLTYKEGTLAFEYNGVFFTNLLRKGTIPRREKGRSRPRASEKSDP